MNIGEYVSLTEHVFLNTFVFIKSWVIIKFQELFLNLEFNSAIS